MSEVKHAKAFQIADLRRHLSQIIIRQHKRLKINLLPYSSGTRPSRRFHKLRCCCGLDMESF